MIYTDKSNLNQFDIPEAAFDELYELYVTTKDDVLDDHHTSVDFFNEVVYFLTCIYANDDSAENINAYMYNESALLPTIPELANPQTKEEVRALHDFEERTEDINSYVLEFVWVILKKSSSFSMVTFCDLKYSAFAIAICDFKIPYSSFVNWKRKSSGKRSILRFTA